MSLSAATQRCSASRKTCCDVTKGGDDVAHALLEQYIGMGEAVNAGLGGTLSGDAAGLVGDNEGRSGEATVPPGSAHAVALTTLAGSTGRGKKLRAWHVVSQSLL